MMCDIIIIIIIVVSIRRPNRHLSNRYRIRRGDTEFSQIEINMTFRNVLGILLSMCFSQSMQGLTRLQIIGNNYRGECTAAES